MTKTWNLFRNTLNEVSIKWYSRNIAHSTTAKCYEDTIQKAKQFIRENSQYTEQTSSIAK